jgi:uncharacterized protein
MNAARVVFLALLLCWTGVAAADVAVPPLSGRVVDQTGTLSSDDIASLTQNLQGLELRKGSQIAVLIVPTTEPEAIEQYSIRVAEAWKIGRKKIDDGALLVIAKNDRHLRIEVGYGLEGALNDATAKRIIDEIITPRFRTGDFAGGVSAGIDRMIGVIDGEPLPAPAQRQRPGPSNNLDSVTPSMLIGLYIASYILRAALGRLFGALVTGGIAALAAWFFVGSITAILLAAVIAFVITMIGDGVHSSWGSGGSGWSSGGSWSGGGGSSSSSDSGGFSGGGGSFGGGGASGSW